jgi:transposase-like protein
MRKQTINENRRCPKCGLAENQINKGYNRSRTQRCMCRDCGATYTVDPKERAYPEETRTQAIALRISGMSGRRIGKKFGMSKSNVYNWIKRTEHNADNIDENP